MCINGLFKYLRVCVCAQRKEEAMMARIKEAESVQLIAELRQKIAEIDIQVSPHRQITPPGM